MFKKLFFIVFIFYGGLIQAQQPAVIPLTEKDGLPDIEFYDILEDTQNYIWLAADNGLYRYDGRNFKNYIHPLQKGKAVFGITEDQYGRIWYTNISGQFFYVMNEKSVLYIDLGEYLKGQLSEFVLTQNELIVLPGKGILHVDLETREISQEKSMKEVLIGSVETQGNGFLFSRKDHIIQVNENFHRIDSLQMKELFEAKQESQISKRIYIATDDTLGLAYFFKRDRNYFYSFNLKQSAYKQIHIPEELQPRTINHTIFTNSEIWFSTDQGLFVCNLMGEHLILKQRLFEDYFITKIISDDESNYWITTKGQGIMVIPNINIYQHKSSHSDLHISKTETLNEQCMLFGSNDGKVGSFNFQDFKYRFIDTTSAYRVSEIAYFPDEKNAVIIKEDKVLRYDPKVQRISTMRASKLTGAKSLSKINDSTYLISTYKQAAITDGSFNIVKILKNQRSYSNYYSKSDNKIYIATVNGLFSYEYKDGQVHFGQKFQGIMAKQITQVDHGEIWVSTFNDGIYGIKNDSLFVKISSDDGLLSNSISTVRKDGNFLWIASDQGIQYLNTLTCEFKNLTKQNGIPTYRISDIEVNDQNVFFATNTGIFSFDKNKAFKNTRIPKVYISEVNIGLERVPLKKSYDLKYNNNSIKISFNSNGFQSFIHNKYEFRLLGQSSVWQVDDNNSNSVIYYGLPSGKYTFQVKSILADRNNKDAIDSIEFTIYEPFWKEIWFYALLIIAIIVIIFLGVQNKINRLKKTQSETLQKELVNKQLILSQLENLRSQMNPHFIFNALNSIQEYIVFNEKDLARSYLVKFSRLIRIYLEHSRENEVLLAHEIDALNLYLELEKNRFEDLLEYQIEVDPSVNIDTIKIPSLFIQPYVENAIKHGLLHKKKNREIKIEFRMDSKAQTLFCIISDNGIGIEASKKINQQLRKNHRSFALSANQKRVDLLNVNRKRKIKVETSNLTNEHYCGTKVIITIPLKTNDS